MSGILEKLSSFFSPSKQLNIGAQPATLNKTKPVNTTANPLSPVAKQLNFGNNTQTGGKRKSLKRRNKKNNKTKRR